MKLYYPKPFGTYMLRRTLFGVNRSITITLKWYYLGVTARKEFPPLLKRLLSIRDKLLEAEGLTEGTSSNMGQNCFESHPSPEILLCYVACSLGRLPTMDRLQFLEMDMTCKLCNRHEENLHHMFFACSFTKEVRKTSANGQDFEGV
ncbi:hypothetical protein M9H77_26630 [Catharanthus roseus]|uniref:Uncharacterized protein n=1 Tax=Catharanthus roseus TaxID=4058 RepID=A0ACC0AA65_CATRO|nr:hypothetical protein M9H77_26630 [Catharanthus roseus]